jgi:hypothetical protein
MMAVFLQAEIRSGRWESDIRRHMSKHGATDSMILEPNLEDTGENERRAAVLADFHALMDAWTKERTNHARLCALALSAGIQQRQLDLVESQANQIVAAMASLLMSPRLERA